MHLIFLNFIYDDMFNINIYKYYKYIRIYLNKNLD